MGNISYLLLVLKKLRDSLLLLDIIIAMENVFALANVIGRKVEYP